MKVLVVIATKNRVESLRRLIESIVKQTRMPDELVIVDASTDDETIESVLHLDVGFEVTYMKQATGGLPSARNSAIKKCSGDIIVFLDDDVVLDEKYLDEILTTYIDDSGRKIGGVTGVNIKPVRAKVALLEKLIHFVRVVFLWNSINEGKVTRIGMLSGLPKNLTYVDAFFGHNMSFRRCVFYDFRFDEKLEVVHPLAMGEDLDFSYRVGKKYKLIINPKARLVHIGSSLKDYKFASKFYYDSSSMFVKNFYYIMCKNFGKSLINNLAFLWAILGLIIGRAVLYFVYSAEKRRTMFKGVIYGLKLILRTI